MKRSEMIDKLYKVLKTWEDCEITKLTAEAALIVVEANGMSAPPDETETYYSGDEPGGYHPQQWTDWFELCQKESK